uniref:Uncharacterized protein n=1 Tax=Setaria italica TaxID=4555 RepID=K3YNL3_SETIT
MDEPRFVSSDALYYNIYDPATCGYLGFGFVDTSEIIPAVSIKKKGRYSTPIFVD